MKQNITIEQLNELSEKGKENLRNWYEPRYGTNFKMVPDCSSDPTCCWKEDTTLLPLLSIGQMIEYLNVYDNYSLALIMRFNVEEKGAEDVVIGFDTSSLCDELWHAVNKDLEK